MNVEIVGTNKPDYYRGYYWSNYGGLIISCVGWGEVLNPNKIDYD